jgi:hypothetical protein
VHRVAGISTQISEDLTVMYEGNLKITGDKISS